MARARVESDFLNVFCRMPPQVGRWGQRAEHKIAGLDAPSGFFYDHPSIGAAMKTTIELPDDLYRRAKAEALVRGCGFKDLIAEGLRLALEAARKPRRRAGLARLMKRGRGVIDSGVPNLASNPEHLTGFGRETRRGR
jgi:hypothetical protein